MGPNRELKFALEKVWNGSLTEGQFRSTAHEIEEAGWHLQKEAMIDFISVGDHYPYDMVLSWCENLGIFPERFQNLAPGFGRMFAMARGVDGANALSTCFMVDINCREDSFEALTYLFFLCPSLMCRYEEVDNKQLPLHGPGVRRVH
jgi:Cobalamin-independent synthase, N-terminal domain